MIIIYAICFIITAGFGAKAIGMCNDPRDDEPVTWGRLISGIILGSIPYINVIISSITLYVLAHRAWYHLKCNNVFAFLHKPVFPKKAK